MLRRGSKSRCSHCMCTLKLSRSGPYMRLDKIVNFISLKCVMSLYTATQSVEKGQQIQVFSLHVYSKIKQVWSVYET